METPETTEPASQPVIIYGTTWCYASRRAKNMFDDHQIPYQWIDIDKDAEARIFVEQTNKGFRSVPTIVFPDGSILVEPSDGILRSKLGI